MLVKISTLISEPAYISHATLREFERAHPLESRFLVAYAANDFERFRQRTVKDFHPNHRQIWRNVPAISGNFRERLP